MKIRLNGKHREVAEDISILGLLEEIALKPYHVAVQVNMEIIKRERYAEKVLQPGDAVEIVTFTSGG